MTHLGRDDRLRACRERGVANRERLVVREVPRLRLRVERIAADVQREHEIGLLDDLLPVEVEVREVEQERMLVTFGRLEVPDLMVGESLRLRMTPSLSSHGIVMSRAASRQA